MHIGRDTLLKLTRDFVEKRFLKDPSVTAVFLTGSLRPENAVVENVADIDLLVLHNGTILRDREVVKFSNEYHLDILYEDIAAYSQPRELRGDGWKGWTMWDPLLLHQKGHFFEYTQSIVRSQFEEPVNIIRRARSFEALARNAFLEMQMMPETASPIKTLACTFNAANAIACLSGPPIPERHLLSGFPLRAKHLGVDDLIQQIFESVSRNANEDTIRQWLPAWEAAFKSAALTPADLRLHPTRLIYYKSAIEAQLQSDMPRAALWPMLHTWSLAADNGAFSAGEQSEWEATCSELGLSQTALPERLAVLDTFLNTLEEILEGLEEEHGI